jgi:uncharacterized damage-inducible protein DinB
MQPLRDAWKFTRDRLDQSYMDLSEEQLCWRPHPDAHSIGEILYHIAAAEHYWASRMTDKNPAGDAWETRLESAVRDGFLREAPCPFKDDEMTQELLSKALKRTGEELEPILANPSQKQLEMRLVSPLGPEISGYEGFMRVVQHAGYHAGQIWIYRMDPRFPKA